MRERVYMGLRDTREYDDIWNKRKRDRVENIAALNYNLLSHLCLIDFSAYYKAKLTDDSFSLKYLSSIFSSFPVPS